MCSIVQLILKKQLEGWTVDSFTQDIYYDTDAFPVGINAQYLMKIEKRKKIMVSI